LARIIFAGAHEIVDFRHTRPIIARFIRAGIDAPGGRAASSPAGHGLLRQRGHGLLRQCAHEIVYLRHASPLNRDPFIRAAEVDPR